jgi:hypothetical protein
VVTGDVDRSRSARRQDRSHRRARLAGLVAALAACNTFQDPNVVVDLRVLAMSATPPDQVLDVDLSRPVDPVALLAQLVPTRVCALIADPAPRRLAWAVTMCGPTSNGRCDDADQRLGSGVLDDPDVTTPAPELCVTVPPDDRLLALVIQLVRGDLLMGLGGIDYQISLRLGGAEAERELDEFATKTLRISPRIPAARTANTNPRLERLDAAIGDAAPVPVPLGRCADNPAPFELAAGAKLRMTPIEPAGVREVYVVPTLDGRTQTFSETLRYQWIAGNGGFSDGTTGGRRDISGNPAPLFSDFTAPAAPDIMAPTRLPIWIIQRDERLGLTWYEACLRVVP